MSSTTPSTCRRHARRAARTAHAPASAGRRMPPRDPRPAAIASGSRSIATTDGAGRKQRPACSRRRRRCRRRSSARRRAQAPRPPRRGGPECGGPVRQPRGFPAVARHHSGRSAAGFVRLPKPRKPAPAPPRHRRSSRSGLPHLEEIAAPDERHLRRDAGVLADEIADRDAAVLVELQERPVAMHEERHVVRRLQERILQRDPLLVAVEQIHAADIQRRHVQRPQRIELRIAALLQHRAEMRRHGDPPLRIDPVHRTRQKPVHHSLQPLPRPRSLSIMTVRACTGAVPAVIPLRSRGKMPRAAQPPRLPVWRTLHPELERSLD